MRRFLVLLIAVLLLQFSWIAAASACTHETASTARHFGHHQHEHKARSSKQGERHVGSNSLADDDCVVCHLACGTASPPAPMQLGLIEAPPPKAAEQMVHVATWSDPPDRPRWLAAS